MQQNSILNFKEQGQGPAVILIHGLFGSLDNLGLLARALCEHYRVISVDLRNHGASFHSSEMSYPAQAADILALMDRLEIAEATLIGHSMGGKVGMQLAKLAPARVSRLVVADMAPVAYPHSRHQNVFAGLNATLRTPPQNRSEAEAMLAQHIELAGVRQFLLKSFAKGEYGWGWRFNVPALEQNYANIMGWPEDESRFEGPVLFIKGGILTICSPNTARRHWPNSQRQRCVSSRGPATGCMRKNRLCSTNWLWISCRQAVNSFKSFVI